MIEVHRVPCPYCGETYEAIIDTTVDDQEYVEDCEICCRPIVFTVRVDLSAGLMVQTRREDDA